MMRIGSKRPKSSIPVVDLVPMMDVLMSVLTFFVVLSMSLTGQQIQKVTLPTGVETGQKKRVPGPKIKPFVLGIDSKGQLIHEGLSINASELAKEVNTFLKAQPNGQILVMADRSLSYAKVTQILRGLRSLGGSQVSLAVQPFESP